MPKDTKTLGNSKARACESLGFVHKKGCARVLTQPPLPTFSKIPVIIPCITFLFSQKAVPLRRFSRIGIIVG